MRHIAARPDRVVACGVQREMVQATASEHRLRAGRVDTRNLKGMQDRVRAHLDEGVTQSVPSTS
jgi:hypothetical protein